MRFTSRLLQFIPRQSFPDYRVPLADFKGHHAKALNKIAQLSPQIDLVLEVRDSRAPISTRNQLIDEQLQKKTKIVIYSKKDLCKIDIGLLQKWHKNEKFILMDCRKAQDIKKLVDICVEESQRYVPALPLGLRMIVTGMPNVGKSTLVNSLRKFGMNKDKKVSKTGGQPGVTRNTSEIIKIKQDPEIYLYDTPGISVPRVKDSRTMLTLALVGTVKTSLIDPVIVADYLLYILNRQGNSSSGGDSGGGGGNLPYSKYLATPTNDVDHLLKAISEKINKPLIGKKKQKLGGKKFDEIGAAIHWIDIYRQGKSAKVLFDEEALKENIEFMKESNKKNSANEMEKDDNNSQDSTQVAKKSVNSSNRSKKHSRLQKRLKNLEFLFAKDKGKSDPNNNSTLSSMDNKD